MPTYQYRCTDCGEPLEVVQSFTDAALTECPNCGGALRKVFSSVGVVFKGSGFYRTDSRAAETKTESAAASGSDSGSTPSTTKTDKTEKTEKTESKPAAAASSNGSSSSPAGKPDSSTSKSSAA